MFLNVVIVSRSWVFLERRKTFSHNQLCTKKSKSDIYDSPNELTIKVNAGEGHSHSTAEHDAITDQVQ